MPHKRKIFGCILAIFLAFHMGLHSICHEWHCECDDCLHPTACCCNCPKCVEKRDGLLSYCHIRHGFNGGEKTKGAVLESATCSCFSGGAVFNIANDFKGIVPSLAKVMTVSLSIVVNLSEPMDPSKEVALPSDPPG